MTSQQGVNTSTMFVLLISSCASLAHAAACLNSGIDNSAGTCTCKSGFYGVICDQYADSYQLTYDRTPVRPDALKAELKKNLAQLNITTIVQISVGNAFKLTFHRKITAENRAQIQSVASTSAKNIEADGTGIKVLGDIVDFNECKAGSGRQSCDSRPCINTEGSFKCGCKTGEKAENFKCVKDVDTKKTVIYIWSGVVAAVVLIMLAFIIFYRWKKIEKGKRLQQEQNEKIKARSSSLTPTNLNQFDQYGQMRRPSPTGSSVLDGPIVPNRRMSAAYPPDVTSLYSYSSRMYPMSEPEYVLRNPDFARHRLSAPILDPGPNFGMYENDGYDYDVPKYSASLPQGVGDDGMSYMSGRASSVIPTSFPSDMTLTRDDRYEQ